MKRGIIVLCLCIVAMAAYFTTDRWAIRHTTLTFHDVLRDDRNVTVEVAVRRDRQMQAMAEMIELPVAILSHGNTVKNTEYSFLTNLFASRGYLVISIQHDLDTDAPMVTKVGEEYVGRRMQYNRGVFNIMYAVDELKKLYPNANYRQLTLIGHSNGGDISMFFAKQHPDLVKKVVTLDNLRVPFITDGKIKILSFRSRDPVFKADPGVVPDDETCARLGIKVVRTEFQHNDLSDRGPGSAKSSIQAGVEQFLDEDAGESTPTMPLLAASTPASASAAPPENK
ncbi:pimeloyl-ACP methyl ester carboxylesterase [Bradyrhizobium japonicum]|uniref:Pimeloyl-ACP methyl ester carboxylesterase n=1 Tax=Bradyrhizobium elkanii TaxID=29448 RepID=A0ABV4F6N4_BRAEL|nr:alpha/beta hydrolase [Bradyrhizobium elkanii]MBP2433512.1 pimeloyl-ACP methyl ester carboxylesterase [Bradyrhizobium elkanii]MCP1733100.1 pimeloyl-ACP methyl ester carboxylesterase [Bradyrhizobium elkanii]MCP1750682.1 pimeloyl-ACP methyl ester carboxylesterase [Bradyrhizobium elkanii]MCP1976456.1 pimeloyl-ACP methyl ester carboxylesterase [Bradyrhizobium elkanii]MCS3568438.1 pimeloyl-ACP methyl ester carboxylesterase [Bradyrhizobium elkanii]